MAGSIVLNLSPNVVHPSQNTRLPHLPQPVDTNLLRGLPAAQNISPTKNTTLHLYDQDVVRELSLPPDSVSPSANTRPLPSHHHSHGSPTLPQLDGPPSSYLTSPIHHNVPLDPYNSRPRTPSVSATQPSFFTRHGLPNSLPPPPRTTFCSNPRIPTIAPEADNIVSYIDSIFRGSYSQMLSKKTDTTATSNSSAPEFPQGSELALSLDDMLRADCFDPQEEFLTSPLIQDDSPDETPFLDTPAEDAWTSPLVDAADDSFGYGDMALFSASASNDQSSDVKMLESLDLSCLFGLSSTRELSTTEPSKMDSVTPLIHPLDSVELGPMSPMPAYPPTSLYKSPRLPSSIAPPPVRAATDPSTPTLFRSTKPIPTGTRRNITSASLVPLDAPTQPRQYITPSVTSRKELPSAFVKGKKRARSEVDGGVDELLPDGQIDPNTKEAIETKRRQNTLAARRSRQRKLEHIRELEDTVERITQDRDMWMNRAYDAEAKLRANGIS